MDACKEVPQWNTLLPHLPIRSRAQVANYAFVGVHPSFSIRQSAAHHFWHCLLHFFQWQQVKIQHLQGERGGRQMGNVVTPRTVQLISFACIDAVGFRGASLNMFVYACMHAHLRVHSFQRAVITLTGMRTRALVLACLCLYAWCLVMPCAN